MGGFLGGGGEGGVQVVVVGMASGGAHQFLNDSAFCVVGRSVWHCLVILCSSMHWSSQHNLSLAEASNAAVSPCPCRTPTLLTVPWWQPPPVLRRRGRGAWTLTCGGHT